MKKTIFKYLDNYIRGVSEFKTKNYLEGILDGNCVYMISDNELYFDRYEYKRIMSLFDLTYAETDNYLITYFKEVRKWFGEIGDVKYI